jgi:hypothetical protein
MTREEYQWWWDLGAAVHRVVDMIEAGLVFEHEVFMKRVRSYYPASLVIDGDPIEVRIKRQMPSETDAMEAKMQEYGFSLDGKQVSPPSGEARKEAVIWLENTIREFVSVAPGQIEVEDDDGSVREVTTGLGLVSLYGGRLDVVAQLLGLVWGENKLPAEQKERYRAGLAEQVAFPSSSAVQTPVSKADKPERKTRRQAPQTSLIDASEPATTGAETS